MGEATAGGQSYRGDPMAWEIVQVLKEKGGLNQERIRRAVAGRRGCEPSAISSRTVSEALDALRSADPSPISSKDGWGGYRLTDFGRRLL
jgi:hypothetical protein